MASSFGPPMEVGDRVLVDGNGGEIVFVGTRLKTSARTVHSNYQRAFANALPPRCPHNSGPIQWARGDVGLKPYAAARPDVWT